MLSMMTMLNEMKMIMVVIMNESVNFEEMMKMMMMPSIDGKLDH